MQAKIQGRTFNQIFITFLLLGFQNEVTGENEHWRDEGSCDGTLLHRAVKERNLSYIRTLSKDECELYFMDDKGLTPMHVAILEGARNVIIALAEAQFDVYWSNEKTLPVLQFSVMNGTKETTKILLDLGSAPNAVDFEGNTALYYALKLHKQDIAELLVSYGADINMKDKALDTYYHKFVLNVDLEALMILSSLKADPNNFNIHDQTPLSLAIQHDAPSLINFLISHGANVTQEPYLEGAISSKKMKSLKALLENGISVNLMQESYTPSIELAIANDDPKAMDILASFGVTLIGRNGYSLLTHAVARGSPKVINWFLDKGLKLEKDENGNNLLHLAVQSQQIKSLKALLSRPSKIDVNDKNKEGMTPLNLATDNSDCNDAAIVKELLENGADVEEKGRSVCHPLTDALYHNCTEVVNVILSHGANINQTCTNGNSALIFATAMQNYGLVEKLLMMGADTDLKGQLKRTALHWAALHGNNKIAKKLLHHGASFNLLDESGQTPYELARDRSYNGTAELLNNKNII